MQIHPGTSGNKSRSFKVATTRNRHPPGHGGIGDPAVARGPVVEPAITSVLEAGSSIKCGDVRGLLEAA